MSPRRFFTRQKTEAFISAVARDVATASRQAVRRRVEEGCLSMRLNELRGYVRARAAQPVQSRLAQRLQSSPAVRLSPAEVKDVARRATDRVVQVVVRDLAGLETATASDRKAA